MVRDAAGSPLRGVRLWRYDQWGNEAVIESQAGDAEAGPIRLSALTIRSNVHYVQVIDAGGAIISPVIEIQHRQGEASGCPVPLGGLAAALRKTAPLRTREPLFSRGWLYLLQLK